MSRSRIECFFSEIIHQSNITLWAHTDYYQHVLCWRLILNSFMAITRWS